MASGLETRDQNYDPCLAYVVSVAGVDELFTGDHNLMCYIKSSRKKPATWEQDRMMFPVQTGTTEYALVHDTNMQYFEQPSNSGCHTRPELGPLPRATATMTLTKKQSLCYSVWVPPGLP